MSGRAGQPTGQGDQPAPQRLGGHQPAVAQPQDRDPAQQVVGQGGDDQPGRVGQELARGAVPQPRAVLEIADGELHHRMAAMIGIQLNRGSLTVGDKGVVAPVRPQGGLDADQAGASHDQPVAAKDGLGDLGDTPSG